MVKNEGFLDRLLRVVIAIAALIFSISTGVTTPVGMIALAVAGLMAFTGLSGECAIYRLVGIRTRRR